MQYAKRTPEVSEVLGGITAPVDFIDPAKIQNPETQCFSVKYLAEFEGVLDKTMNDMSLDRATRRQAE